MRETFTTRRAAVLLFTSLLAVSAWAQAPVAKLLTEQSEILFTTRQMGVPVEGRFGRFSARIALDPRQPAQGSVTLEIDTGSARFGTPELDAEIGKPEWLGTGKFAQASFRSSAIQPTGAGRFNVSGKLSIKGIAHDLVIPVQLVQTGRSGVASGSFTIRRLDYQVGEGEWTDTSILANDVVVRFKLTLGDLPPP